MFVLLLNRLKKSIFVIWTFQYARLCNLVSKQMLSHIIGNQLVRWKKKIVPFVENYSILKHTKKKKKVKQTAMRNSSGRYNSKMRV